MPANFFDFSITRWNLFESYETGVALFGGVWENVETIMIRLHSLCIFLAQSFSFISHIAAAMLLLQEEIRPQKYAMINFVNHFKTASKIPLEFFQKSVTLQAMVLMHR